MHRAAIERLDRDLGELLARHERGRDLSEFSRHASDPVGFIRDVLHGNPWSQQVEIAEAVRDAPLTVVRSCNGAGKDWLAARLALWWCYTCNGLVLVTGPTERQVIEVVMGEVAAAFRKAKDLPGDLYRTALRVEDRAAILAFTSTEASKLTGFHAPRVLALITEAQGVGPFAWEGLLACATGAEDRVLAVGNPLAPEGRFFACTRSPDWRSIRIAAAEHPNIVEGRTVIPGGPSRAWIGRMRSEYGEGSPTYVARVEGEFPQEAQDALCERAWVEAAFARHEAGELEPRGRLVVAVDPARFGSDETVVAAGRWPVVERLEGWRGKALTETAGRAQIIAEELCGDAGKAIYAVDEPGLGSGVVDALKEQQLQSSRTTAAGKRARAGATSTRGRKRFGRCGVYWSGARSRCRGTRSCWTNSARCAGKWTRVVRSGSSPKMRYGRG